MPRNKLTPEEIAARTPEAQAVLLAGRARHAESKRAAAEARALVAERRNPLPNLPEKERAWLFTTLRDCPYDDAVLVMLREKGIEARAADLREFFEDEARGHWETRLARAAAEANALVQLAEEHPGRFSAGILAALGQETFRQIASGQAQPDSMNRMAMLFLRAKADERADQMSELKREKLRQEMRGDVGRALEKMAEEVAGRPEAREAFEELRRALGRRDCET